MNVWASKAPMVFGSSLGILLFIFVSIAIHTGGLEARNLISISGFSAIEVSAAAANPEGFSRDFPGGSRVTTSNSPLTWAHVLASFVGIDPVDFYYLMIGVEISTYLGGAYLLWQSMVSRLNKVQVSQVGSKVSNWGFISIAIALTLGNGRLVNLANFGFPFFHGQFYGFADGLRLAALAFALRGKWGLSGISLAGAFVVHPIMGALGAIVVFIVAIFASTSTTALRNFSKLGIFPLVAIPWTALTLRGSGPKIPLDEYVAWTRVFQSHWYPIDLQVFTGDQFRFFVPFAVVIIAAMLALNLLPLDRTLRISLSLALVALVAISFLGVAISYWPPSEFLVKLSLVRASEIATLLSLFIVGFASLYFLQNQNLKWGVLFSTLFLLLFLPTQVFLLLSLIALGVPVAKVAIRKKNLESIALALTYLCFLVIHVVNLSNTTQILMAVAGAILAILTVGASYSVFKRASRLHTLGAMALLIIGTLIGGGLWGSIKILLAQESINQGREYLEVQNWARENTPPTSLFMVDPCINYGWRDFSQRPSLGTPREWYMTGWLYTGDKKSFDLGAHIGKTLGLDLDPAELGPQSGDQVCALARNKFYEEGLEGPLALVEEYDVNFFVLIRSEIETRDLEIPSKFDTVLVNKQFVVIQPVDDRR